MIICQVCGNENRTAARYCRFCGQPIPLVQDQVYVELPGEPSLEQETGEPEPEPEQPLFTEAAGTAGQAGPEIVFPQQPELVADQDELEEFVALVEGGLEPEVLEADLEPEVELMPFPEPASDQVDDLPEETEPVDESEVEAISEAIVEVQPQPEPALDEDSVDARREDGGEMLEQEQPGLAPGVVIDGRLRILKSEITADGYFLEVEDLLCCWNCQAVQSELSLRFCENCGAELQPRPTRRLQVWQLDEIATLPDEPAGEWLDAGGYRFVFQPIEQPASPATPQVHLRLGAGYRSDTGMERDIDEDSLLVLNLAAVCEMSGAPMLGFYAVADGIGGNDAGEVASRIAVHALAAGVLERLFLPQLTDSPLTTEQMTAELKQIVLQANQAILSMRNQSSEHTNMGSTLTAALIHNQQAIVVNVGDSRTYLMREGHLSQVTSDHSLVARLAAQGVISPQEIYTHEQRSVIYRSLGDRGNVEIDLFEIDLQAGDRLLLCSDGLWEMVRDPLIEEVLLERFDPQQACNRLVELANLGGGDDNISVIVVDVQPL